MKQYTYHYNARRKHNTVNPPIDGVIQVTTQIDSPEKYNLLKKYLANSLKAGYAGHIPPEMVIVNSLTLIATTHDGRPEENEADGLVILNTSLSTDFNIEEL